MAEPELTPERARRLVALGREARWPFPSSAGRPLPANDEPAWLVELRASLESLLPAARVLRAEGDDESAAELAANVWRLWILTGEIAAGREFLAAAVDGNQSRTTSVALALYGDGLLALWQRRLDESRARNEAALEIALETADDEALGLAKLGLARLAFEDGEYERARRLAGEGRRHTANISPAHGQAPLHVYAQATRLLGDLDAAAELLEQSLELNRQIGDSSMIVVELHNVGHVAARRGDAETAARYFGELHRLATDSDPYSTAMRHLNAAALAYVRGESLQARQQLEAVEAALAAAGFPAASDDQAEIEWLRTNLVTR